MSKLLKSLLTLVFLATIVATPTFLTKATPAAADTAFTLQWVTGSGSCGPLGPTALPYGFAFMYDSSQTITYKAYIKSNAYGITGSTTGSVGPGSSSFYSFTINLAAPATVNPPWTVQAELEGYLNGQFYSSATADLVCDAAGGYQQIALYYSGGPGCDAMLNIPDGAVGGKFVKDAPIYWKPGEMTEHVIPAGNTARVIGQDASGQYYQIIWVCDFVWVPADTLAPNDDAVWNGAALPVGTVQ